MYICPPHLHIVATLPWEIQKSHFSTVLFIHTVHFRLFTYVRKNETVTERKEVARGSSVTDMHVPVPHLVHNIQTHQCLSENLATTKMITHQLLTQTSLHLQKKVHWVQTDRTSALVEAISQGSDTRACTQKNPVGFFGKPTLKTRRKNWPKTITNGS